MKKKHLRKMARNKHKERPVQKIAELAPIVETVAAAAPLNPPQTKMRSLSELIKSELNGYEKKMAEMNKHDYQRKVTKFSEKVA